MDMPSASLKRQKAAFPIPNGFAEAGMTLRDYFAAAALSGVLRRGFDWPMAVERAYQLANLMILERAKETK